MYLAPLDQLKEQVNLAKAGNVPLAASSLPLATLMSKAKGEIILNVAEEGVADITFDLRGQLDVTDLLGLDKSVYAHEVRWECSGSARLKRPNVTIDEYTLKGNLTILEEINAAIEGNEHISIVAKWTGTREIEVHVQ